MNRWSSEGEMLRMRHGPLEVEQGHQMGSSWDYETAMWSVEISADDLLHCLSS